LQEKINIAMIKPSHLKEQYDLILDI
jgi:hypothetical protein